MLRMGRFHPALRMRRLFIAGGRMRKMGVELCLTLAQFPIVEHDLEGQPLDFSTGPHRLHRLYAVACPGMMGYNF